MCPDIEGMRSVFNVERNFEELTLDSFKELAIDKATADKVATILNEYEYEKYTTLRVPSTITIDQMKDLLALKEPHDRQRWFNYLFKRQHARTKSMDQQKKKSEVYWSKKRQEYAAKNTIADRTGIFDYNNNLMYGLWHNTLFSKILKNTVNRYYSHRLRTAALFGQKLVIDFNYDQYMKLSECRQMAKQIHLLYNWNRYTSKQPFDLHFTNCRPNEETHETTKRLLPHHNSPHFLVDFHQKSYIDLFPKERLVYLSPHSEHTLKKMDPDDIYIIGAILDKSYHHPISYVNAKKDKIRCVKLPLDEHIIWAQGSKSLCINHILQILHDVSQTGDWSKALKDNIPKRKQKTVEDIEYEDRLRKQKLNRLNKNTKFDPKIANNKF